MVATELEKAAKKAAKKAPHKASKKSAKKAAKKGSKHDHKESAGKDVRRAYEHLGRLEALQGALSSSVVTQIQTLSDIARLTLLKGESKSSADLLRASEHLAFASLASNGKESVNEPLMEAIREQYEKLLEKAADHWDENEEEPSETITTIYENSLAAAEKAFTKGAYRKALELARAAEALSHVRIDTMNVLSDGSESSLQPKKKLKP